MVSDFVWFKKLFLCVLVEYVRDGIDIYELWYIFGEHRIDTCISPISNATGFRQLLF